VCLATITGIGLRVTYVIRVTRGKPLPVGDALNYHLLAESLAHGAGYIRSIDVLFGGARTPTAEFPPLWPMVMAALDLVGIDSPTGHRLAGALLGGLTIIVVAMIGEILGGRIVGAVAAAGVAMYPQWIVLDVSLLSEGLFLLLVSITFLGVLKARSAEGFASRRWWLVASAALGLAAITRMESVLLLPLMIVPATRHVDRRVWARGVAVGSAGVLLVLGAWTVRNAVSLGHFQPFTNNSGTLIAGSNCDTVYRGPASGLWSLDCVPSIDFDRYDEVEGAAAQRRAGINYALDHLSELPRVGAIRVGRTFGVWDVRKQLFFESFEGRDYHWLWAGWVMWIVLLPLAAAGAVVRRRDGAEIWMLLVPFGIVVLVAATSYGNQRFRVIAEPSVALLAATGGVAMARALGAIVVPGHRSNQGAQAPGGSL